MTSLLRDVNATLLSVLNSIQYNHDFARTRNNRVDSVGWEPLALGLASKIFLNFHTQERNASDIKYVLIAGIYQQKDSFKLI